MTAIKIAEAVLVPIYSERVIAKERPLHAKLDGDVWTVEGTLTCGSEGACVGVWPLSRSAGVHVDFDTLVRTPKASARFFAEVIRSHGAALAGA